MAEVTYLEAIRQGLQEEMRRDENVFLMGEDVGRYGGCFACSKGLLEEFGPDRIRDTPLAESVIAGAGIGAAIAGLRPPISRPRSPTRCAARTSLRTRRTWTRATS